MSNRARRAEHAEQTCARKIRYATWDEARLAGVAVWRENPNGDANMPTPYPCYVGGEKHYHCGHIRFMQVRS